MAYKLTGTKAMQLALRLKLGGHSHYTVGLWASQETGLWGVATLEEPFANGEMKH
jgi:hypothetical protein